MVFLLRCVLESKVSSRGFREMSSVCESLGLAKLMLEQHFLQAGTLSLFIEDSRAVKLLSVTGLTHAAT